MSEVKTIEEVARKMISTVGVRVDHFDLNCDMELEMTVKKILTPFIKQQRREAAVEIVRTLADTYRPRVKHPKSDSTIIDEVNAGIRQMLLATIGKIEKGKVEV